MWTPPQTLVARKAAIRCFYCNQALSLFLRFHFSYRGSSKDPFNLSVKKKGRPCELFEVLD
uniref:Uncharacterized protein n=1 Tax=Salix viminalis TaxID=40686 RepID=A0A6N2NJW1_SALVM